MESTNYKVIISTESQYPLSLLVNINIRDEQVCSMETSGTALTPKHSSPHCVAEWGVSRFNGQAISFTNLKCCHGHWSLFACPLHPPHPYSAKQGMLTSFGDQRIVALVPQTTIITSSRMSGFKENHMFAITPI